MKTTSYNYEPWELAFKTNPEFSQQMVDTLPRDYPVMDGKLVIKCNVVTDHYHEVMHARSDFSQSIPRWIKFSNQ